MEGAAAHLQNSKSKKKLKSHTSMKDMKCDGKECESEMNDADNARCSE